MRHKLKVTVLIAFLSLSISLRVGSSQSFTFTTEDIITTSVEGFASNCLEYCFTGICFWLVCTPFGCYIKTSPQVSHFWPDLVVTAHKTPGDIPWVESKRLYSIPAKTAAKGDGGSRHVNSATPTEGLDQSEILPHENLFFKDTSVIGSPITIANSGIDQVFDVENNYICPTDIKPLYPYFLSEFDHLSWRSGAWRSGAVGPEIIYRASWIPGMREVGPGIFNSWGSVHPRIGFILTNEEPKGAAVIAQRAVDIATRNNQPHIYQKAPLMNPSNEDIDKWQMLSPKQDRACAAFGQDSNYAINRNSTGNYGWLYWSNHECCWPNAGVLIGTVDIPPVCI